MEENFSWYKDGENQRKMEGLTLLNEIAYLLSNDVLTAVANNNLEEIYTLEKKGSDLHFDNDRALFMAAKRGYIEIVQYLIEKGLTFKQEDLPTLVKDCSNKGYTDVLHYLVTNSFINIHDIDCTFNYNTKKWMDNFLLNQNLNESLEKKNITKNIKI